MFTITIKVPESFLNTMTSPEYTMSLMKSGDLPKAMALMIGLDIFEQTLNKNGKQYTIGESFFTREMQGDEKKMRESALMALTAMITSEEKSNREKGL